MDGGAVITGRITAESGEVVGGANVYSLELQLQEATGADGRFRLVIPRTQLPSSLAVALRARAIGYRPTSRSLTVSAGDSIAVDIQMTPDINRLEEIVVTGVMQSGFVSGAISLTNTQHAGVDEGGIVKMRGDYLVILRRGRLFTVAVGDNALRPIAAVDAFGPGMDPQGAWYDELLLSGDKVVVIGYSYRRGGSEIGIFRIDSLGGLDYLDTYQLRSSDYYSSRNYASRLIGDRLIFYSTTYAYDRQASVLDFLPAMRRWDPRSAASRFEPIATPQRVYRVGAWRPAYRYDVALHTVTTCDLSTPALTCQATVVAGPSGDEFYVSPRAVYVWMTERHRYRATADSNGMVVRMPLDGSTPTAIGVRGGPVDQFSFLETDAGWLNVLVRDDGSGSRMWHAERTSGNVALLSLPVSLFRDGSTIAADSLYRALPAPNGWSHAFRNRFVGNYLLYGAGSGWRRDDRADTASLFVVPVRGGEVARLTLPHAVDRIEVMGSDAVVVGSNGEDLLFSGIHMARRPAVVQQYTLEHAAQGETRSHGFFYRPDSDDAGVLGLPIVDEGGRAAVWQLFRTSAAVLFLRNTSRRFEPLGRLNARRQGKDHDNCRASCVDWYGNARPLFLRDRVFALMGYELVEGRLTRNAIGEVRRVSFAPGLAMR